jgi:peptidoglycan/xylan/chitin deacetylase (PgdA/CDA1 family)
VHVGLRAYSAIVLLCLGFGGQAAAAPCSGNPDALGTDRVIAVDPAEYARIGTMQYRRTLPLRHGEVVLTFDDGPLPPYTNRILETLAAECVRATFFIVGRMARANPELVRRVYNHGHTVATHSQNHPLIFTNLSLARAQQEVDSGIAAVATALGDPDALAPFFRFPGLGRSNAVESYLASRSIMTWSADFPADDWRGIGAREVERLALERLERKGRGVLLLHDIQPATVLALPNLLRELKRRGYRIVHVVPAGVDMPTKVTAPEQWVMNAPARQAWPRVRDATPTSSAPELPGTSLQVVGFAHPRGPKLVLSEAVASAGLEPGLHPEFGVEASMTWRQATPASFATARAKRKRERLAAQMDAAQPTQ